MPSPFLKCSECGAAFAPAAPNQLTCSPECKASRHAVKKQERLAAPRGARLTACALPGCTGTFERRHNAHRYCTPQCAKRAETARHAAKRQRSRPGGDGGRHPKLLEAGQLEAWLEAWLESCRTRADLDTWHREAAWCYAAAPDKRIPVLMREARGRMQDL